MLLKTLFNMPFSRAIQFTLENITYADISKSGEFYVLVDQDGKLEIRNSDGNLVYFFSDESDRVSIARIVSSNIESTVIALESGKLKVITHDGKVIDPKNGEGDKITLIDFSATSKIVFVVREYRTTSPIPNSDALQFNVRTSIEIWNDEWEIQHHIDTEQIAIADMVIGDNVIVCIEEDEGILFGWDFTGRKLFEIDPQVNDVWGIVEAIRFSPDGNYFITGSHKGHESVWSKHGKYLGDFGEHPEYWAIRQIEFAPNGEYVATTSFEYRAPRNAFGTKAILYKGGKIFRKWDVESEFDGEEYGKSLQIGFSTDSAYLFLGADDTGKVDVFDIEADAPIAELDISTAGIVTTKFISNGKLVTITKEGIIYIWQMDDQSFPSVSTKNGSVWATFSPKGDMILLNYPYRIEIRDEHGEKQYEHNFNDFILDAKFSPTENIVSIITTTAIYIIDINEKRKLKKIDKFTKIPPDIISRVYSVVDGVVKYSKDGKLLASFGKTIPLKLWDSRGHLLHTLWDLPKINLPKADSKIANIPFKAITKVGKLFFGKFLSAHVSETSILSVDFSLDGMYLVSADNAGEAIIWDCMSGKIINRLIMHHKGIIHAAFSPNGRFIVTTLFEEHYLVIWDVSSGSPVRQLKDENGFYYAIFSPDNVHLITTSQGGNNDLKLWNINDGSLIASFSGHNDFVSNIRFLQNGSIIATSSNDKTIKLWNTRGELLHDFVGHVGEITSLDISSDDKKILTGSEDGKHFVWDLEKQSVISKLDSKCLAFVDQKVLEKIDINAIDDAAGIDRVNLLLGQGHKFKIYRFYQYYLALARKYPELRPIYSLKSRQLLHRFLKNNVGKQEYIKLIFDTF